MTTSSEAATGEQADGRAASTRTVSFAEAVKAFGAVRAAHRIGLKITRSDRSPAGAQQGGQVRRPLPAAQLEHSRRGHRAPLRRPAGQTTGVVDVTSSRRQLSMIAFTLAVLRYAVSRDPSVPGGLRLPVEVIPDRPRSASAGTPTYRFAPLRRATAEGSAPALATSAIPASQLGAFGSHAATSNRVSARTV